MYSLLATTASEPSASGSFLDDLIHVFLPNFALWAGLMAVIWVTCAVITLAGAFIGGIVVVAVQDLTRVCVQYIRRRRDVEYAQLVTVDADGAHTKVVNLDRYRRRPQHRRSDNVQADGPFQPRSGDDPA